MLFREHIPQLIAYGFGVPDHRIDVGVGVTVNPIVNAAIGDKISEFSGKGAIEDRSLMP